MNKVNIQHAINIMKRSGKVNMHDWRTESGDIHNGCSEEEANTCGMVACFGGWVAVSPEFQASGGSVHYSGAPAIMIKGRYCSSYYTGETAIAYWLGIRKTEAEKLCVTDISPFTTFTVRVYSPHYKRLVSEITAEHVIEKLEELLTRENIT